MASMREIMKLMEQHPYEALPNAIPIDEWLSTEHQRLDRFVQEWKQGNATDPDNWPIKMPPGEWDEQYRGYEE